MCRVGYLASILFRKPLVLGYPYSISVEPTTLCNLQCPECVTGRGELRRRSGEMDFETFKTIVNQVSGFAYNLLLHFQGEPMMSPNIIPFISYATSKRLITEMATNATLINESNAALLVKSGLKKIVISLDSADFSNLGFYRRGEKKDAVVAGISAIVSAKESLGSQYPIVVLELLMFKVNIDSISKFKDSAKKLGADVVRLKTVQVVSGSDPEILVPLGTNYSRYRVCSDGTTVIKGNPNKPCSAPWFKFSVTHDGWIVPCCFDKNAFYVMGSIRFSSLKESWKSKHYNRFRKNLLTRRGSMPVCSECPYGRTPLDFTI